MSADKIQTAAVVVPVSTVKRYIRTGRKTGDFMLYFNQSGEPALEICFEEYDLEKEPGKFCRDLCNGKISAELYIVDDNLAGIEFKYRELGGVVTLGN